MADVAKLRELLERVEGLSGPDSEVDRQIITVLRGREPVSWPRYTASLDASIALVERMLPGWVRTVAWGQTIHPDKPKAYADMATVAWIEGESENESDHAEAYAATEPLAILSALLRALISQAEGEGA